MDATWIHVGLCLAGGVLFSLGLGAVSGLEHLAGVKGAVITCNHFHPMDSFMMQRVFDDSGHDRRLYRMKPCPKP